MSRINGKGFLTRPLISWKVIQKILSRKPPLTHCVFQDFSQINPTKIAPVKRTQTRSNGQDTQRPKPGNDSRKARHNDPTHYTSFNALDLFQFLKFFNNSLQLHFQILNDNQLNIFLKKESWQPRDRFQHYQKQHGNHTQINLNNKLLTQMTCFPFHQLQATFCPDLQGRVN